MAMPMLPQKFTSPRFLGADRLHQVYRGEWDGVPAAIKTCEGVLPDRLAEDKLTLVHSPRLPRFLASGRVEGTSYVVMEFVPGIEISVLDGPPPSRWTCIQLCHALSSLHAEGIPHADLSDRSVRWGPTGLRLVDIGIAREAPERYARAERYVAPEIRQGGEPTAASDMFSLGTLLSELAPDDGDVIEAVRQMTRSDPKDRCSAPEVLEMLITPQPPKLEPTRWTATMSADRFVQDLAGVLYPSVRAHLGRRLQERASEELAQDINAFLTTMLEREPQPMLDASELRSRLGALESDETFVRKQASMAASTLFAHWLDVLVELTADGPTTLGPKGYPAMLSPDLESERRDAVGQLPVEDVPAGDALLDTLWLRLDRVGSVELPPLRFEPDGNTIRVERT